MASVYTGNSVWLSQWTAIGSIVHWNYIVWFLFICLHGCT